MPDPLEGPRWPSNVVTYSFAGANLTGQPTQFSGFITNPAYQYPAYSFCSRRTQRRWTSAWASRR